MILLWPQGQVHRRYRSMPLRIKVKKKTTIFRLYYTHHDSFDIGIDEVTVNSFMITMVVSMKVDE